MQFSVLMSVYKNDNPEYYKLALESVTTNQSLKPTQAVIVYDGPVPDEIDKITTEVKNLNENIEFTVLKQEKNQGLAAALNTGLHECKYEYVARMDSDDISVPNRFELQIHYIQKHPEIDLLGGYISEFTDNAQNPIAIRKVGCTSAEILQMAKRRTPFNHVSVMYRKAKVEAVGGYSVSFGKLEDYKLWVDLIAAGYGVSNLDSILVNVRAGTEQAQRRSNPREIRDWDNLQNYLIKANLITKKDMIINKVYIRAFTYMPVCIKKIAYKVFLRERVSK